MNNELKNLIKVNIDIEKVKNILKFNKNLSFSTSIINKIIIVYYENIFLPEYELEEGILFKESKKLFVIKKIKLDNKEEKTIIIIDNSYDIFDVENYEEILEIVDKESYKRKSQDVVDFILNKLLTESNVSAIFKK